MRKNLELLREGQEALDEGAYEKAAQCFRKAAANDGEEYRAHWGLVCALTENLKTPALSDELDQSYREPCSSRTRRPGRNIPRAWRP